jgi:hypothetical protein
MALGNFNYLVNYVSVLDVHRIVIGKLPLLELVVKYMALRSKACNPRHIHITTFPECQQVYWWILQK